MRRHESDCRFLAFSLSMALSSRPVAAAVKSGDTKNCEKRSSAGSSESLPDYMYIYDIYIYTAIYMIYVYIIAAVKRGDTKNCEKRSSAGSSESLPDYIYMIYIYIPLYI